MFFRDMYSQNNEQELITEVFKDSPPGHFLDVGAYDGKTFSNTLRLVELGWTGVCVEPSPNSFEALLKLHGDNPNITLVNCAVARGTGLIKFFDSGGDAVSSSDPAHVEKWTRDGHVKFKPFWLQTLSFENLFEQFGYQFDFINLDVESLNQQLFKCLPLSAMPQLRCICVEHDGHYREMEEIAARSGFTQCGFNGENILLRR
jgi:FkbM family methyltransferase